MPELNVFRTTLGVAAVLGAITLYNENLWDRVRRAPTASSVPNSCKTGFIAMTVDGGPSGTTLNFLEGLSKSGLKATFHVDPTWIQLPASTTNVKSLMDAGNVIGLRFPDSIDLSSASESEIRARLLECAEKIHDYLGIYPRFVRFNYGKTTQLMVDTATQMGFVVTSYNVDSHDYENPSQDTMIGYYQQQWNQVQPGKGSFISLHLDVNLEVYKGDPGMQFFAKLLDAAGNQKYTFTTLDGCFGGSAYASNYTKGNDDGGSPNPPSPNPPSGSVKSAATSTSVSAALSLVLGAAAAWFA